MMGLKVSVCCVLLSWISVSLAAVDVQVVVEGVTNIAKTDDNFVCATLDWWPKEKCNYNQCIWAGAGLLDLDLTNKALQNAIKAFNPLRLRLGGSLQDQLEYKVGDSVKECSCFEEDKNGLFGFSKGCLNMGRWDELNALFKKTGAKITFGLNALLGKKKSKSDSTLWEGDWDSSNAQDLMNYTISKGYKMDSYELGNELCASGVSAKVSVQQYAKDMITLKNLVKELYPDSGSQPLVLGPGGFYDEKWFNEFLELTGQDVIDGITQHIYNLGAGDDSAIIDRIQDPFYLDQIAQTYKDMSNTINKFGPWAGAWVGESGGAWNSGGKDVSDTFVNGFWYVDQLGMAATFNHKVYCRQALVGGNYALLNTTSFVPYPDYYAGLLWHRLMGTNVLRVHHNGSPYLRVYSHCARKKPGITIVLINMSNSASFDVVVEDDYKYNQHLEYIGDGKHREEYHLTPENGNIQSDVVLLNGTPLKLTYASDIPSMKPKLVDPSFPIHLAPDSIAFVTLRDFKAPACA